MASNGKSRNKKDPYPYNIKKTKIEIKGGKRKKKEFTYT